MVDETDRDSEPGEISSGEPHGDFQHIKDAVLETSRGRWFLDEYARRIRAGNTVRVLDAIARLETVVLQQASLVDAGDHDKELITRPEATQEHIGKIAPSDDVAAVQEKLLDIVWYMRERGFDGRLCTAISHEANKLSGLAGHRAYDESAESAVAKYSPQSDIAQRCEEKINTDSMPACVSDGPADLRPVALAAIQPAMTTPSPAQFSAVDSLDERKKLEFFY